MQYIMQTMIDNLKRQGVTSGMVLAAMEAVPRHLFVSEALRYRAYDDASLPIGHGQTISKPSVIARMVQGLSLTGDERVLEVGTGSGYQSAILSRMAGSLVTMERIEELLIRARDILVRLNYGNIRFMHNDDFDAAEGTYDAVIVAAGADIFPVRLFGKLARGGRLVIPVSEGPVHRIKKFIKKEEDIIIEEEIGEATFVPLIRSKSA